MMSSLASFDVQSEIADIEGLDGAIVAVVCHNDNTLLAYQNGILLVLWDPLGLDYPAFPFDAPRHVRYSLFRSVQYRRSFLASMPVSTTLI
jgi:hypothetical protein